ncbi:hypothetical protein D3C83_271930 [compost metagenome]
MKVAVPGARRLGIVEVPKQNQFEVLDAGRFDDLDRKPREHHRPEEALLLRAVI